MTSPVTVVVGEPSARVVVSDGGATAVVTAPAPVVVVDPGRRGPVGPAGPQGPPGDSTATLSYQHTQNAPATLVQITHGLPFPPAGVLCKDTGGSIVEAADITYPISGVVELTFGFAFTGTVRLS